MIREIRGSKVSTLLIRLINIDPIWTCEDGDNMEPKADQDLQLKEELTRCVKGETHS